MSGPNPMDINQGSFEARVTKEGTTLRVTLKGSADMRAREALDVMLARLHDDAVQVGASAVVVDLRELEFMNSSCIKSFVSWLASVQDLAPSRQYKIRFLSRPELLWQRRSLHALRCFAIDLVSVDA